MAQARPPRPAPTIMTRVFPFSGREGMDSDILRPGLVSLCKGNHQWVFQEKENSSTLKRSDFETFRRCISVYICEEETLDMRGLLNEDTLAVAKPFLRIITHYYNGLVLGLFNRKHDANYGRRTDER